MGRARREKRKKRAQFLDPAGMEKFIENAVASHASGVDTTIMLRSAPGDRGLRTEHYALVRCICQNCARPVGSVHRNPAADLVAKIENNPSRVIDPPASHRFTVDCCDGRGYIVDRDLVALAVEAEDADVVTTCRVRVHTVW